MKFHVTGPDGKKLLMSADNEEAIHHAIQQMHGAGQSLSSMPHPGLNEDMSGPKRKAKPLGVNMNVAVSVEQVPDILDVLERIANRPDPKMPEPPEPPEPPEKIDFAPVIAAIKRLERDEPAPVDLTPMHALADQSRRQMESLVSAVESQSEAMDTLRKDFLEAIQALQTALTAPRSIVRDKNGRAVRSEVVS